MEKGFTLIEILVSVALFIVVMTISMGAILGIFTANSSSQAAKVAFDNLNSGLETMSRELRFGTEWHCDTNTINGGITSPQECQGDAPGNLIAFLSSDGVETVYRLSGTTIQKSVDGGLTYVPVTSNEVNITQFSLIVVGLGTGFQPKAYILIKGTVGGKSPTNFSLQSLVSQRVLNTGIFTPSQGGSPSTCSGTNLVGCWIFNEGSGSSSIDSSGNGHGASLFGNASWVAGASGQSGDFAVSLPGTWTGSDEVDINGGSLGSTSVTVSAWFMVNSFVEATMSASYDHLGAVIFDTRGIDSDVSPTLMVTPMQNDGSTGATANIAFVCDSSATAVGAKGGTPIILGQWYHAVGVYTAGGGGTYDGTWNVYLNGIQDNPSSNNFNLTGSCSGNFTGSTWYLGNAPQWSGGSDISVDDVRVYNRALSSAEIQALPYP